MSGAPADLVAEVKRRYDHPNDVTVAAASVPGEGIILAMRDRETRKSLVAKLSPEDVRQLMVDLVEALPGIAWRDLQ